MPISETEKDRLLKAFEDSYTYTALKKVWVDSDTLEVNVDAFSVRAKFKKTIPFKMGTVTGNYFCDGCDLESLHNAPHTVMGNFICRSNYLSSLEGGPTHVGSSLQNGGLYSCAVNFLKNFEGAPTDFSGHFLGAEQLGTGLTSVDGIPINSRKVTVSAQPKLPLLKLTQYSQVELNYPHLGGVNGKLTQILQAHTGQGKPGALKCAAAMIKAGYKDNARW
jgi:hypothetical protein